jgi:uncharacterized DUF497 family protein
LTVYTIIVYYWAWMAEIEGFDWDAANVGHIRRLAGRPHVTIPAETIKGEKRWKLFGKTACNRYLAVVFTIRRKLFRTVTAYEMNAAERRKYAPQID